MNWLQQKVASFISYLVMPAQLMPAQRSSEHSSTYFYDIREENPADIKVSLGFIPASQGAKINYLELMKKKRIPLAKEHQKVIIFGEGNAARYEFFQQKYVDEIRRYPQSVIVGFNYRNVGESTGKPYSEEDWVDDIISLVNHYVKKGYKKENILLHGHSFSGAVMTMAAAKMYQEDKKKDNEAKSVKLFNNRSFSTLTNEVVYSVLGGIGCGLIFSVPWMFLTIAWMNVSLFSLMAAALVGSVALGGVIIGKTLPAFPQFFLYPVIDYLLKFTLGNMDAAKAYRSLPMDAKAHIMAKGDKVICQKASLHRALKPENSQKKRWLREEILKINLALDKNIKKYDKTKLLKKLGALKEELLSLKDAKVKKSPYRDLNEHVCGLSSLHTYHKNRARSSGNKQISGDEVMRYKIARMGFN